MAQVTMDGKEYVELIHTVNTLQAENQLLINTLVVGTLEVDADSPYRKVTYKCAAELQDEESMRPYMDTRIKDVTEKLEQNPLAVQLLCISGDTFFNPLTGHFNSYGWDKNVPIAEMSKEIRDMMAKVLNGEMLVPMDKEEEDV